MAGRRGLWRAIETTSCKICGKEIVWKPDESKFGDIIDAVRNHQKTDIACQRESKLKEILS